jgi:adenylate cyclase
MPRLIIDYPGQRSRVFELFGDKPVAIGRGKSSGLLLDDLSVSRMHAVLQPTFEGRWQVIDRGSANGVQVNGVRVREALLRPNDEVMLGKFTLRFEEAEQQALVTQAAAQLPPRLAEALNEQALGAFHASDAAARQRLIGATERRVDLAGRIKFLEHESRLLTLLYRVNRVLSELNSADDVCERVLDLVLEIDGTERGYAMLLDEGSMGLGEFKKGDYKFQPAIIRYREERTATGGPKSPGLVLSQIIVRQVMEGHVPLLVTDAKADPRFSVSESVVLSRMQSAMCAPLGNKDRCFGLLYVDNLSSRGTFSQEDLNIFAVIAAQAGLAIERVRARTEMMGQKLKLTALERFLSPEVAQKVVNDAADLRLGGENQKVTLLFCDIRGFTTMSEAMAPEDVVEILNGFFLRMTELVFAHQGTIDKYLGDGLMCLFGAPFPRERAAHSAVLAAIQMQKNLAQLNRAHYAWELESTRGR